MKELKQNYHAIQMRKKRLQRKKFDLCIRCGKQKETNLTCCNKCRERTAKYIKDNGIKSKTEKVMNAELIEAMSDKQYSAITLARLMNVPLRTIERWVSEGVTPRPPNAIKLNDLLGRKIYEVKQ
jgi:hypothetical protein